jgi:chromatin modification-related protein EAF6
MAENAPPQPTTPSTGNAPTDSSRGMPYYEKLRKDLRDALSKKRALDQQLTSLEDNIYRMESSYLEDTSNSGNIVKGFDLYMKAGATGGGGMAGGGTATRRKGGTTDADRIFSRSSAVVGRDSPAPSGTPGSSHAATPTASGAATPGASALSAKGNGSVSGISKKKKAPDRDGDDEEKPPKRGKITYGRD